MCMGMCATSSRYQRSHCSGDECPQNLYQYAIKLLGISCGRTPAPSIDARLHHATATIPRTTNGAAMNARSKSSPIIIRRGDMWEFLTNNGVIDRHIRSVASGRVSYLCNGRFYQCSIACFRQWARGAFLLSAENWEGREKHSHER